VTLLADAELVSLKPHMHLRGSGWNFARCIPRAKGSAAERARYDFNWQLEFVLDHQKLPKARAKHPV
jgi:hypothetical protein